jgi:hypothetical protein
MDYDTMKPLWEKFDRGDPITDSELGMLKKQIEQGISYLEARGERFVLFKSRLDLERINGYIRARKER